MGLRIVVIGQAAFGEQVLTGLVARGDEVVAVYAPADTPARPDPLAAAARAAGVACRQPPSYKAATVHAEVTALAPDLMILAYVTQIVPLALAEVPRLGSICFHPSLLPRHRGGSAINWSLIAGEHETGVSVFWVDAGIDTGPLLLQRAVPIAANDSAASLYYGRIVPAGVALVLESVALIEAGRAPRIVQDESRATYEPLCRDAHARVDWSRPAGSVHDLIRGCDPQPGAYTSAGASQLRLYDSHGVESADATSPPGTILTSDSRGVVVAAGGSAVRFAKGSVEGSREKKPAFEALTALGVGIGDRLGSA
jgi:methionyl-tRNA formyltransferase